MSSSLVKFPKCKQTNKSPTLTWSLVEIITNNPPIVLLQSVSTRSSYYSTTLQEIRTSHSGNDEEQAPLDP